MFGRKKLKGKIKFLERRLKDLDEQYERLNGLYSESTTMLNDKIDEISKLNEKVEGLERERDMLYEYYDLNKEPSQEIKTLVRINERVRKLELENIELRSSLKAYYMSNLNALNYYYLSAAYSNNCLRRHMLATRTFFK